MRVLVAHGDKSLRQLIKLKLACAGYDVVLADDALEAGRAVLRQRPDLIVLDVDMPYLADLEFVCARVGAPDAGLIPVLFLTRHMHALERAQRLGAPACLTSPLDTHEFLEAVAHSLTIAAPMHTGFRASTSDRAA